MSQKTLNLCLERYNFVKFGETTKSSHTVLCINNANNVNSAKYRLTPTAIAGKHGDGYVFTLNYDFDRPLFTIVQKSYALDGTSGNIVFEGIDPVSKDGSKYLRRVEVSPVKLSDGSYLLEVTKDEYLRIGTTGAALGDEDLESLNEKIVTMGGIEKSVETVGGKQVLKLDAGGPSGAKEIVYFEIDPSDPPSGIYDNITVVLSNDKEPVIRIDGAVYFYTAAGTDKYVFVGGYTKDAVGYTEIEVSDDDSVTSKSVDDKVFNMFLLYKTDPASPGDPPGEEDSWVCDANKHVITKDELVAAHADCRYFILNNDVDPDLNSRKYFAAVTNVSNSYVQLRFYMVEYSGEGAANFYQKTVSNDSEGRLYISDSYQTYLAGTSQAVLVSEPQSFNATQKAQGRDNIGAASASDVTALQSQVSSLSDVSAYSVKGEATVAQLNAGPSGIQAGWAYQLTDSGTLTDGSLAVVAGDTVAWDGTKWFPLVRSDYYAPKTYAQNVAHSIAPEFDPTRDSEHAYKAGETVTYTDGKTYTFTAPHYGAWTGTDVYENRTLIAKGLEKKFSEQLVRDVITTDGDGKQFNVNLFELVIPVPKNTNQWFNKNAVVKYNAYLTATNNFVGGDVTTKSLVTRVLSGKKYCVSLPNGVYHRFYVAIADKEPMPGDTVTYVSSTPVVGTTRSYINVDMPVGYTYIIVYYYKSNLDVGVTDDEIKDLLVINEGDSPEGYSDYEFSALSFDDSLYRSLSSIESLTQLVNQLDSVLFSKTIEELVRNGSFTEVSDITDTIDFEDNPDHYYASDDTILSSQNFNISEAIPIDRTKVYALAVKNGALDSPYIVYFSNSDATTIVSHEVFESSVRNKAHLVVINPPKDAVAFKVSWGKQVPVKLYEVKYDYNYMSDNLLKQVQAFFKQSNVIIEEDLTSSLTYENYEHAVITPSTGLINSNVSHGKVTTPIAVDRNAIYSIDATYNQYALPVCYYKDADGYVRDSTQELPAQSGDIANFVLFIPPTAKSFRIGSYNETNLKLYKVHFEFGSESQEEIQELTEDVEQLQSDVATLQSSAFLNETIDTINAVKYIPQKEIKLGADIFNLSDASYSPTHWSVNGDNISFETTGATTDEFDTGIAIPSGGKYYVEVTITNYTRLENLFYLKLGSDGDKIDIYDGTSSPCQSLIGNGGNLIIYTTGTNINFTLTIKLSPVVTGDVYARSVTFDVKNVTCGNGDGSIIDAKWNVAIGPRENCFARNINATRCVAIGHSALSALTSGWQNIAIGTFAMAQVARGDYNIAIGADNTYMFHNAWENIAIGRTCLYGLGSGQDQTARRNVIIGCFAGRLNTSEEVDSVYIGNRCAQSGIGSRCVFIGANVPGYSGGGYNRIGIGYGVDNNEDNTAVIGNGSITKTKVYGNLIVEGTDHVKRKIVFNNDNTCSWEAVS